MKRIDIHEVAKILGVSTPTAWKMVHRETEPIPCLRLTPHKYQFFEEEVTEWYRTLPRGVSNAEVIPGV